MWQHKSVNRISKKNKWLHAQTSGLIAQYPVENADDCVRFLIGEISIFMPEKCARIMISERYI